MELDVSERQDNRFVSYFLRRRMEMLRSLKEGLY
jgi:hypothetical protein